MSSESKETQHSEWLWKMEYCKKNGLPPAQSWAWKLANKAYAETHK